MQDILTQNYFELFGLPVRFELDGDRLAQQYRQLQQMFHPDKFAGSSEREQRLAVQLAAHINQAHQILKSPRSRARYLLELRGVSFDDEKDTHLDPQFLMEQIALREEIENIATQPEPQMALDKVFGVLRDKQNRVLETLAGMLQSTDIQQLAAAKAEVQKLQFLGKLQQEAENIEEKLLDEI